MTYKTQFLVSLERVPTLEYENTCTNTLLFPLHFKQSQSDTLQVQLL